MRIASYMVGRVVHSMRIYVTDYLVSIVNEQVTLSFFLFSVATAV